MTPPDADSAGAGGDPRPPDSSTASVALAGYALELGGPPGTLASVAAQRKPEEARPLAQALKEEGADRKRRKAAAALPDLVEDASEATAKAERAVALFRALAEGKVLDPKQLSGELDGLLDLLERLDRSGRWREALRLGRALSGLLALLMRWTELVRSLRVALRAAQELGDLPAIAWARHELGTLQLVAGDSSDAERSLGEARQIRQRLGDRRGLAATERNLQVLCQELRQLLREGRLARGRGGLRRSPVLVAAGAATLLFAGGVAGAVVGGDDGGDSSDTVDRPGAVSVQIRAPVEGARFRTGAKVVADYGCAVERGTLRSCRGGVPDGNPIDTTAGRHAFTVTATAEDGRQATETVSYSVSDRAPTDRTRPRIRIASPRPGPLPADRRPRADYGCAEEPGGSGIASCRATLDDGQTVDDGEPLDVDPGPHTFTVIAADAAGNRAQRSVIYNVAREGASECRDGRDNDGDRLIDGGDPGCGDGTEEPLDKPSNCSDGEDNDGDGLIDGADPGCSDGTEEPAGAPSNCSDGKDNDGDGLIDDPKLAPKGVSPDPGCSDGSEEPFNPTRVEPVIG